MVWCPKICTQVAWCMGSIPIYYEDICSIFFGQIIFSSRRQVRTVEITDAVGIVCWTSITLLEREYALHVMHQIIR